MMPARALTALDAALEGLPAAAVQRDAPLAPWCSVRVGGAAEALVRPPNVDAVVGVLRAAREHGVPVAVLGGGANTLVGDGGVPGIVLKLPADLAPEQIERVGERGRVTVCAGAAIARVVTLMKLHRWVGAEFLAGIPGTLGGAVTMNAGTKHGECMSIVEAVELATPDGAGFVEGLSFRYRHTELPTGSVVTRVRFALRDGDLADSQRRMDEDLGYRKRTQPLSQPNFGSVFTNPPGHFAGQLIESVKLKGHRIGNAQFSTLHANWIVNLGQATAKDVTSLMDLAQQRVREATGVELTPEVQRLGVFLP
ncbi:MAG: UDP-N-acetylmuramate dehydrogenase [Myxococcaceae bacterium]|nr:UDP-N-acetylmuramate dehydrogenase [Myxococcaceae bacterium]